MGDIKKTVHLNVPLLARVEGEGALELSIHGDRITDLKLNIFEPPRFFEKLLQGRHYSEVPDIVARICGICPVAYQMSAVLALEQLFEVDPGDWVRRMRRVYYCGEWLESHSLHVHLLALPDFLGFNSGPEMAKDYPEEVRRGLRLQALGNGLIRLFGARSVNPVGVRVGGFYKAPAQEKITALLPELEQGLQDAMALLQWCTQLQLPEPEYGGHNAQENAPKQRFNYVALDESEQYPLMGRTLLSSRGQQIPIQEFEQYFVEKQVPHSTALHCYLDSEPYFVGPLARVNLFRERLPVEITKLIPLPGFNSFHSLQARVAEMVFALQESISLLRDYEEPNSPYAECKPRPGVAYGCSEAPRGFLWHRYVVDKNGLIKQARIVPPTSQNQAQIERDISETLQAMGLEADDSVLKQRAEQVIRNYDPCISCATHFLKLNVRRQ